jgi:hypothetical protein
LLLGVGDVGATTLATAHRYGIRVFTGPASGPTNDMSL